MKLVSFMTRIYSLESPKKDCWILRISYYLGDTYYGTISIGFTKTDIHTCGYSHRFVGMTLPPATITYEMTSAFTKVQYIRQGVEWRNGNKLDETRKDIFVDVDSWTD